MALVKNPSSEAGDLRDVGFFTNPGSGRSPGGGNGNQLQYSCLGDFHGGPIVEFAFQCMVFLTGKPHWQRSLEGYSPKGHKESDTNEVT